MKPTKHHRPETIILKPTNDELMEVDPEVVAVMKARLQGQEFYKVYDTSDRMTTRQQLDQERKKLKTLFQSPKALVESFSSIKNTKKTLKSMQFYKVDRKFLSQYADAQSEGLAIDEVDFYAWFVFQKPLIHKHERVKNYIYFLGALDAAKKLQDGPVNVATTTASTLLAHRRTFINQRLWPLLDDYQSTNFSSLGQTKALLKLGAQASTPGSKLSPDYLLQTFYTMPV